MSARVLYLLFGLGLILALPDLARSVEELGTRVAALEARVAALEASRPSDGGDAEPLDPAQRREAMLTALASRLGIEDAELAGLGPGERAWRIQIREAALQAWLLATQVAGNQGLLQVDERIAMAQLERRCAAGRGLAAPIGLQDTPPQAWRVLEEGVRALFADWLRAAGRVASEEQIERLLVAWRSSSVVIVREPLDRGARWRAELVAPVPR